MSTRLFKTFRSTDTPWTPRNWFPNIKLLVDNITGAPVGIQSVNASGPDGLFVPIDLTSAQINAPTAAMLADINATYRLNVAPYTRYQSTGTALVEAGGASPDGTTLPYGLQTVPVGTPNLVLGPNSYDIVYSPFTVQNAAGVTILGRLKVITEPP